MARPARFFVPGYPWHVTARGNDRAPVFFGAADHAFYLDCLVAAARRYACDVHAYVLMTNHVHLLATPAAESSLPRMMQSVGRRYAQYVNFRRERSGTLWEGRYRAAIVDSDAYFFTCSRYIELNPVRAGMVARPDLYRWSSFHGNACGAPDALLRAHPSYLALGASADVRQIAYRALFDVDVSAADLREIRESTQKGWPLGGPPFRARIEALTRRCASPRRRGGRRFVGSEWAQKTNRL